MIPRVRSVKYYDPREKNLRMWHHRCRESWNILHPASLSPRRTSGGRRRWHRHGAAWRVNTSHIVEVTPFFGTMNMSALKKVGGGAFPHWLSVSRGIEMWALSDGNIVKRKIQKSKSNLWGHSYVILSEALNWGRDPSVIDFDYRSRIQTGLLAALNGCGLIF